MRRLPRTLLIVAALLVLLLVAVYWWQRPMLLTGTGYAAHNACAVQEVADRDDPASDLPDNPLVPVLRTGTGDGSASASILGLLAEQTAWHTDGYGCTLADTRPDLPPPTEVTGTANPFADLGPDAVAPDGELADALAHAFGDDLDDAERDELGTRAVVVVHRGEVVAERYADGFTPRTAQLGWSMSKSAANLITGMLVARGDVALDDAGLREAWTDERAGITIDDLLRMTSGLAWDETYELGSPITRMLYLEEDMGGYVASQPAAQAPGTYQQYSSGSTALLCDVLAERSGLGADLPRATLFSALGMSSAVMEPDGAGTPVCSSYLWATPRDWAAMGRFALQEGEWDGEQLLPDGWMQDATTVVEVAESEEDGLGSSWWANTTADGTPRWPELPDDTYMARGHDGQRIVVVPSADLVVVRMGFTPDREDLRDVTLTARTLTALPGA